MTPEFQLIRRYFTHRTTHTALGVGDDAALLVPRRGTQLAVSADMLVEGTHFHADAEPRLLGHKSLAVNLSDMAAMGAEPRWATLALALPRVNERWIRAFAAGFMAHARRHGVDLVGGDTTRGPLAICVQVMGEVPSGRALRRDAARSGDDIWASGELGDAAAALAALQGKLALTASERRLCERRLHAPTPRVALGRALVGKARAAIDISDGLLADLGHILERSGVAAEIELAAVPASRIIRRYLIDDAVACRAVLAGGDDYELCFTASQRRREQVIAAARRVRVKVTRIGVIRPHAAGVPRLVVRLADGTLLKLAGTGGYDHFS